MLINELCDKQIEELKTKLSEEFNYQSEYIDTKINLFFYLHLFFLIQ